MVYALPWTFFATLSIDFLMIVRLFKQCLQFLQEPFLLESVWLCSIGSKTYDFEIQVYFDSQLSSILSLKCA